MTATGRFRKGRRAGGGDSEVGATLLQLARAHERDGDLEWARETAADAALLLARGGEPAAAAEARLLARPASPTATLTPQQ